MKKIAIIGYFGSGEVVSDGQGVKTKILSEELIKEYGRHQVILINTYDWKRNAVQIVRQCISAFSKCKNIIFLTDENGIKVFPMFLTVLNLFYNKKVHYYVVGGWLNQYLDRVRINKYFIKKIDAIYVELPSMKSYMDKNKFSNTVYINKFRDFTPITLSDIEYYHNNQSYKLCTFSRVLKEKGIEEAINSVIKVNEKYGEIVYELDIYGKIDPNYEIEFKEILDKSPNYIKYCGVIDYNESNKVLKKYFALLFPTYYKSEGYPNTFVDAFAAGVPVIASDFKYNRELINEGHDGFLYTLTDDEALTNLLFEISMNPELINEMKKKCLERSKEFSSEKAIKILKENLE